MRVVDLRYIRNSAQLGRQSDKARSSMIELIQVLVC